jgi:hypothetical protein
MRENNHEAGEEIHFGDMPPEFPGIGSQESHEKSKSQTVSGSSMIGISVPLEKEANENVYVGQIGKNGYEENIWPTVGRRVVFETDILNSQTHSRVAQR